MATTARNFLASNLGVENGFAILCGLENNRFPKRTIDAQ